MLALLTSLFVLPTPACLDDLQRFPPLEEVRQAMQFNRDFLAHAQAQAAFQPHRREWWNEVIEETEISCDVWGMLYLGAKGDPSHLEELREAIGHHAYMTGTMPDIVPRWALQPGD